ncbi:hypothetical protein HDU98_001730 [Podochytrium sp. JEL0797]|nr:hypothetical protein HDU98_001730 [Podochytrium sp. JEL0797]
MLQISDEALPKNLVLSLSSAPFSPRGQDFATERRRVGCELMFDGLARSAAIQGPLVYPVKSAQEQSTLMAEVLKKEMDAVQQCGIVYYLLKDASDALSLEFANHHAMPTRFVNVLDGLWSLDHGDFENAVVQLTSPHAINPYPAINAHKIARVLTQNGHARLAARVLKNAGGDKGAREWRRLEVERKLEEGDAGGAFLVQRMDSENGDMEFLETLLSSAFKCKPSVSTSLTHVPRFSSQHQSTHAANTLTPHLLSLPYTRPEEHHLITHCHTHSHHSFLLTYYLHRGRTAEAVGVYETKIRGKMKDVDALMRSVAMCVPGCVVDLIQWEKEGDAMEGSVVVVDSMEEEIESEAGKTPVAVAAEMEYTETPVLLQRSVVGRDKTPGTGGRVGTTPKWKDPVVRVVGSPYMKRPLTPTLKGNNVSVEDVMNQHARQRSESLTRTTTTTTTPKLLSTTPDAPAGSSTPLKNAALERSKSTHVVTVTVSPVGKPVNHGRPLTNMSPFAKRQVRGVEVNSTTTPHKQPPTAAPDQENSTTTTRSNEFEQMRQTRKTPARPRKSIITSTIHSSSVSEIPSSAPSSHYSLRTRPQVQSSAGSTPARAVRSTVAASVQKGTTKAKKGTSTPAVKKVVVVVEEEADDPMTLEELVATPVKKSATAGRGSKSTVKKGNAAGVIEPGSVRVTRRMAKLQE